MEAFRALPPEKVSYFHNFFGFNFKNRQNIIHSIHSHFLSLKTHRNICWQQLTSSAERTEVTLLYLWIKLVSFCFISAYKKEKADRNFFSFQKLVVSFFRQITYRASSWLLSKNSMWTNVLAQLCSIKTLLICGSNFQGIRSKSKIQFKISWFSYSVAWKDLENKLTFKTFGIQKSEVVFLQIWKRAFARDSFPMILLQNPTKILKIQKMCFLGFSSTNLWKAFSEHIVWNAAYRAFHSLSYDFGKHCPFIYLSSRT